MIQLSYLDLSGNKLRHLNINYFNGLVSLEDLLLSGCEIEIIDDFCFAGLNKLRILLLNGNNIKHLKCNDFKGLHNLINIHLYNSAIESIENGCFSDLHRVEKLLLSPNNIPVFDISFLFDLKALEDVTFNINQIFNHNGKQIRLWNNQRELQFLFNEHFGRYIRIVLVCVTS